MKTDQTRVAGVLLAAGTSSRMGRNKLLLRIDHEPLVHRAARRAIAAGIDPLIVVVGHEADAVRAVLADLPCTFVHNPVLHGGMSGSLRCGLEQVPADAAGTVILLADMVYVSEEMIRAVRETAATSSDALVVSRYGDILAPPLFFRRALFSELMSWQGEGAGRGVARRRVNEAAVLEWPGAWLEDVDTPADLEKLR